MIEDLNKLKIEESKEENKENYSRFTFQYFPTTVATTIANYLRRSLINLIKGVTLIAVEIKDKNGFIKTEMDSIDGVNLITFSLIANLRKIVCKIKDRNEDIHCLKMDINNSESEEEITIKANNFSENPNLEVKNPEFEVLKLAQRSTLSIKLYFKEGYGYYSKEKVKKYFSSLEEIEKEGLIFLDSAFSPIRADQVNIKVEERVTGLEEKEEQLILDLTTNGIISPREALKEALNVMEDIGGNIRNKL